MEFLQSVYNFAQNNIIFKSNTFNFLVLVVVLYFVSRKINLPLILENIQKEVTRLMDDSIKAKEDAQVGLNSARDSIKNLDMELKAILANGSNNAAIIAAKILEDGRRQADSIKRNTERLINTEEIFIISDLSKMTSMASLEVAKKFIITALEKNPELHNKYINESIEALDRL